MCGIWGKVTADTGRDIPQAEITRLCRYMAHRGPDGAGAWSALGVGLGHRRLSIIDLGGGHQPMSYADGRYWITYNGEIYNYRGLRETLGQRGHSFQTASDTEVILAAYAEWGAACAERLNGIFAFGIWDATERVLFLARDHFGIKPLLYHHDAEGLTFCSELKPLIAEPQIAEGGLSAQGVADYLALGYVLSPRTIVEGVRRLPPGHTLMLKDNQARLKAYWDLADYANQAPHPESAGQLTETFAEKLESAVQAQLVADVPLGAFLSGGVDSSSVVAMMQRGQATAPLTFSMGFTEKSYSELDYAEAVANHLGSAHHTSEIDTGRLAEHLPQIVWAYDEPLGDTSVISTYYLSQVAAQRVKVALSGDGADELLAGYDTYFADRLHRVYRHVPSAIQRGVVMPLIQALPSSADKVNLRYQLAQFARHGDESPEVAHYRWRELFSEAERAAILGEDATERIRHTCETFTAHYAPVREAAPLNQALYVDINTWMLDDILPKVDRASMAASLEVRVPFLDPQLAAFTMGLPTALKLRGLERKVILKRAMRPHLPDITLKRRKRGFNAPTSVWMRGILRESVEGLLSRDSAMLDTQNATLRGIWQAYLAGQADHGYKLWALVSLLLWEKHVWQAITQAEQSTIDLTTT